MDELEYLEENRSDEYDKAIVFIHGWKGNKDSFTSLSSISLICAGILIELLFEHETKKKNNNKKK